MRRRVSDNVPLYKYDCPLRVDQHAVLVAAGDRRVSNAVKSGNALALSLQ